MEVIREFGADLAFAGLDTIGMSARGVNLTGRDEIVVSVADGEWRAEIGGFVSVEQAEAAMSMVHQGSLVRDIVGENNKNRFDFAVGVLKMIADQSYVLPTPAKDSELDDALTESILEDIFVERMSEME